MPGEDIQGLLEQVRDGCENLQRIKTKGVYVRLKSGAVERAGSSIVKGCRDIKSSVEGDQQLSEDTRRAIAERLEEWLAIIRGITPNRTSVAANNEMNETIRFLRGIVLSTQESMTS